MTFEEWLDDKVVRKRLFDLYLEDRQTERRVRGYDDYITDQLIEVQRQAVNAGSKELPTKLAEIPNGFPCVGTVPKDWEDRINAKLREKEKS